MIYTELTRKAMEIACNAHFGQTDKSGFPYIHHPLHLAEQMEDEGSCAAALLHDVVEDTDWTLEGLRSEGIPEEVLTALALLTHEDNVPYMEYVRRIGVNPIAKAVKLADLRHNSDTSRLSVVTEKDLQRVAKYRQAMGILLGEME